MDEGLARGAPRPRMDDPYPALLGEMHLLADALAREFDVRDGELARHPAMHISEERSTFDSWGIRKARRAEVDTQSVLMTNISVEQALPEGVSLTSDFAELRIIRATTLEHLRKFVVRFPNGEGGEYTLTSAQAAMAVVLASGPPSSRLRFEFRDNESGRVYHTAEVAPAPARAPSFSMVLATMGSGKTATALSSALHVLLHRWEECRLEFEEWQSAPVNGGRAHTRGVGTRLTRTLILAPTLPVAPHWIELVRKSVAGKSVRVLPNRGTYPVDKDTLLDVLAREDTGTPVIIVTSGISAYLAKMTCSAVVSVVIDELSEVASSLKLNSYAEMPSVYRAFGISATPSKIMTAVQTSHIADHYISTLLFPKLVRSRIFAATKRSRSEVTGGARSGPYPFFGKEFLKKNMSAQDEEPVGELSEFIEYLKTIVSMNPCPALQLAQSRCAAENMPPAVEVYNLNAGLTTLREMMVRSEWESRGDTRSEVFGMFYGWVRADLKESEVIEEVGEYAFVLCEQYRGALRKNTKEGMQTPCCATCGSPFPCESVVFSRCCMTTFCLEHVPSGPTCQRCSGHTIRDVRLGDTMRESMMSIGRDARFMDRTGLLCRVFLALDKAGTGRVIVISQDRHVLKMVEAAVGDHRRRCISFFQDGRDLGNEISAFKADPAGVLILRDGGAISGEIAGANLGCADAIIAIGPISNPQQAFSRGLRMSVPRKEKKLTVVRM